MQSIRLQRLGLDLAIEQPQGNGGFPLVALVVENPPAMQAGFPLERPGGSDGDRRDP